MPWVFGYGSLIWRPAFPFVERRPGFVRGWARRFWQASPDHRGTVEHPGRVVTLVKADDVVHGMAYRVDEHVHAEVVAQLDHREKAGYEHHRVTIEPHGIEALIYIAGPDNPNFVGPAPIDAIAARIARCHGPSGANLDYLLELGSALEAMGVHDPHVVSLIQASMRLHSGKER